MILAVLLPVRNLTALSPETLKTLADLTAYFEAHPEALEQFQAHRAAAPDESGNGTL